MQNSFTPVSSINKNSENVFFDKNYNTFLALSKPTFKTKLKSDLQTSILNSKLRTVPFKFTQFKVNL